MNNLVLGKSQCKLLHSIFAEKQIFQHTINIKPFNIIRTGLNGDICSHSYEKGKISKKMLKYFYITWLQAKLY